MDLFFCWATPLVQRGYRQEQLQTEDLLPLPATATPRTCTADLWNQWCKTCCSGRPSLLRALIGAYGGPYYCLGMLKLLNDGLTFAGAMLLNLLVQHLEQATSSSAAGGGSSSSSIMDSSSSGSNWLLLPGWFPGPGSPYWGFVLAGLLGLSALAKAIIGSQYNYGLSMVTVRLRAGVMGVLFRAALLNRAADAPGDVSTLMAVDTGRLANLCVSFHELWSLPLQIAAAMWLLYLQVRTAFIAGVLLCVALIPVNRLIAQRIQAASVSLMLSKDARLGLMGQLLAHVGVVKALGWEQVLGDKVLSYRSSELSALALRKYLDALCVYFWAATQLLLSGTTFGLMVLLGQPLRPSVVFTCLALCNVLIAPLNAFPWVINGVVEAVVSLRRVQAYLLLPQRAIGWAYAQDMLPHVLQFQRQQGKLQKGQLALQKGQEAKGQQQQQQPGRAAGQQQRGSSSSSSKQVQQQQQLQRKGAVALERGVVAQFDGATFAWRQSLPPCLLQLQLAIPVGCLTAVVGEVGSGKSSLLAALLGELELTSGAARLPHQHHTQVQQQQQQQQHGQRQQQHAARIGYVGQCPWIMRGSVRDNVLMGQPYDAEFMGEILHAVGLDQDLAAMPAGDLSPVGDGGQGLSGGQRLRVALARALYQPGTDTYLFDDILASLDGHVAQWVIRHTLFGGLLSGATVVVVTKHPMVIQAAQLVVALEHGRLAFCGSPQGYAHWKALQACQQAAGVAVLPTPPSWVPLIRHSTPGPRRLRHQQQYLAANPQLQPPPQQQPGSISRPSQQSQGESAGLDVSPPASPLSAAAAAAAAGSTPAVTFSEDVAPSELLLAAGHGVWACHASLSPQLNAIEDDEEDERLSSSQSLGRSLGRSFERLSVSVGRASCGAGGGVVGAGNSGVGGGEPELAAAATAVAADGGRVNADGDESKESVAAALEAAWQEAAQLQLHGVQPHQQQQQQAQRHELAAADDIRIIESTTRQQRPAAGFGSGRICSQTGSQAGSQQQQKDGQAAKQHQEELPAFTAAAGTSTAAAGSSGASIGAAAAAAGAGAAVAGVGDGSAAGASDCEEGRAIGAVKWSIYATYVRTVGIGMSLAVLISLLLMQATKNGIDLWVTHSLSHSTNQPAAPAAVPHSSMVALRPAAAAAAPALGLVSLQAPHSWMHSNGSSCFYAGSSAMAGLAAAGGMSAAAAAGLSALSLSAAAADSVLAALLHWNTSSSISSSSIASVEYRAGARQHQQLLPSTAQPLQLSRRLLLSCGQMGAAVAALQGGGSYTQQQQQQQWNQSGQPKAAAAAAAAALHAAAGSHLLGAENISSSRSSSSSSGSRSLLSWKWRPARIDPQMAHFLKGLGIIAGLNTLATLARAFSFAAAGMSAARGMHQRLLAAVLAAPMSFFDANPAGRILNRFSSDTSMVDDSLPFILNILLANAVSLAGLLAVLLLGQPLLVALLLPLGLAYRWLQLFYRASARELRRLEAQGLSPLYSLFGEAVTGAPTLRAAAAQRHFMKRFLLLMEPYQSACMNNAAASNWLGARLQLLAAVLLLAVASLAAAVAASAAVSSLGSALGVYPATPAHHDIQLLDTVGSSSSSSSDSGGGSSGSYSFDSTGSVYGTGSYSALGGSAGTTNGGFWSSSWAGGTFRVDLLGLALAYCLPIVQLLNGLLSSSAETEQEMVSVERVVAYLEEIVPEEQQQQQQQLALGSSAASAAGEAKPKQQQHRPAAEAGAGGSSLREPLLQGCQQQECRAAAVALPEAAAGSAIAFVDVYMRYRPELPPALRGVSFSVKAGQKLGICGRTGAGKSSIVSALLRLRPIQSGLIVVQGEDASALSLRDLRGRFGVVPQSPVLFSGSIRENLDPWGRASDEQLAAALQAVRMWAPLCRAALLRGVLAHGTYLLARKAGSAAGKTSDTPAAAAAATGTSVGTAAGVPVSESAAGAAASAAAPDWWGTARSGGLLTAAALAEGAAAAMGAVAGSATSASGQRKQQQQQQQEEEEEEEEFPPVPMRAAEKVLGMQVCGTHGLQLSAGQSQLVCLARLLLRAAPLVLLDEATAAVDPRTAALMHQVLHEQLDVAGQPSNAPNSSSSSQHQSMLGLQHQRPAVLQVAHELSAIIDYDAVVVMAGGRVVESGNPRQLAAQQGSRFANLLAQAWHHHDSTPPTAVSQAGTSRANP